MKDEKNGGTRYFLIDQKVHLETWLKTCSEKVFKNQNYVYNQVKHILLKKKLDIEGTT